jgi:acyl carrier protein
MTEKFLQIIKETVPGIVEKDLQLPVRDIGIDSIDLVVIRVALEKEFKHEAPDREWFKLQTLEEVLNYFTSKGFELNSKRTLSRVIEVNRSIEVGMPQMANNALSENWLLKELGDIHWKLLSDGLEQKSSEFKDDTGSRLYATFTRISYSCSPLNNFRENSMIDFKGYLKRFGSNTYLSEIDGKNENYFITAKLMTNFSVRSSNDNSKIEKSNLQEKINHVEEIKTTPEFLNNYRLLRKNLIDTWKISEVDFPVVNDNIAEYKYCINPWYDINGVGLLYFAAYPVISDFSLNNFFLNRVGNIDWIEKYQTVTRDINYFANCNANETIVVRLNSIELIESKGLRITTTLTRLSDNIMLAKIFTIKKKI